MSTTWVIIVIVLVLGVVIGNITLLKYSAKFKFPTPSKPFDDDEDGDEYGNPNKASDRSHAETETASDHASLTQAHNDSGDNEKKPEK